MSESLDYKFYYSVFNVFLSCLTLCARDFTIKQRVELLELNVFLMSDSFGAWIASPNSLSCAQPFLTAVPRFEVKSQLPYWNCGKGVQNLGFRR
jgi:hypothetical protein